MSEQVELFDIVEPDFHWVVGGNIMTESRFESSAPNNDAAKEKPSSIPQEKEETYRIKRGGGSREKAAELTPPRACFPLLPAPEHIYGEHQIAQQEIYSESSADFRVSVKETDLEKQPRRVLFDSVDIPLIVEECLVQMSIL